MPTNPSRRTFLGAVPVVAAAATAASTVSAAPEAPGIVNKPEMPVVVNPRATSGDLKYGPVWDESYSLAVGNDKGDLQGNSERVLQAAIDCVAHRGGGIVKLLPGKWRLRNAVYLRSNVSLIGSGPDTILTKEASVSSKLAADSDWYDQEITLEKADGFQVGDGICLRAKNAHHGGAVVIKRTLMARSGNRFKLDEGLRENLWSASQPTVATLFPLLSGDHITNVKIQSLTLDGNRANNLELDGNYAGCIFLQDCANFDILNVHALNNHGDGISWQICHDVHVEDCLSKGHSGLGLHPGSGSQRPIMRNNKIIGNGIGLFFCWGVKFGLAEGNQIEDTRTAGISVGHRDTDNLIRNNIVRRSGQAGILFRPERGPGFTGDRNIITGNTVEDTGSDSSAAIDIQGVTANLTFEKNLLTESRGPAKRVGIRIGEKTSSISIGKNQISGFAKEVEDKRTEK